MADKPEARVKVDLPIRVWGMGADGRPFFQNAQAVDISSEGAKLSGIERHLTAGDIIGVQLGDKKARFRVIWVIDAGALQRVQAGVKLIEGQQCPWMDNLTQASPDSEANDKNRRRFPRHKVRLPIELSDPRSKGARMQTNATDVGGRGCYVETLMPLPKDTALDIVFWIESEKVVTTGIVRACDGGVGMGIEFTGLPPDTQERLQQLIEKLDVGFAGAGDPKKDAQ